MNKTEKTERLIAGVMIASIVTAACTFVAMVMIVRTPQTTVSAAQHQEDLVERERFKVGILCTAYRDWTAKSGQASPGMASVCS